MCIRDSPKGALVVVEAEHQCMSMRGIQKPGAVTITSAVRGIFLSDATRAEAMQLIGIGRKSYIASVLCPLMNLSDITNRFTQ